MLGWTAPNLNWTQKNHIHGLFFEIILFYISDWLAQTSEAAFRAFERGAVLATKLRDGHLLKACATCFWNHCLPAICGADHRQLVGTIKVINIFILLECAGKLGYSCLTLELYAALTIILAHGLIQPWLPKNDVQARLQITRSASITLKPEKLASKKTTKSPKSRSKDSNRPIYFTAPPEAQSVIKQAAEYLIMIATAVDQASVSVIPPESIPLEYTVQQRPCEDISLSTRSRLIHLWLVTRQLSSGAPTYKGLYPGDSPNSDAGAVVPDEKNSNAVVSRGNKQSVNVTVNETGILFTRALLAVHSVWLTNCRTVFTEWSTTVSQLLDEHDQLLAQAQTSQMPPPLPGFKDVPSLNEAIGLMKSAFYHSASENELYKMDDRFIGEEPTAVNSILAGLDHSRHRSLSVVDRATELQLWIYLAQCSLVTEQHAQALAVSELSNLEAELKLTMPDKNDHLIAQLLNLRGLSILGLAKLHRAQTRSPGTPKTRKPRGVAEYKLEPIKTIDSDNAIVRIAGETTESSLFAAAEEAFYRASEFAARAKRYDMTLIATKYYWSVCMCPELALAPSFSHMCRKFPILRQHCKEILDRLVGCLDANQRTTLNAQIRLRDKPDDRSIPPSQPVEDVAKANSLFDTIQLPEPTLPQFEVDLQLRVEMYMLLFDLLISENDYDAGLELLTEALSRFPRTEHRLALFKRLVETKAKLGHSVQMDMQKFSNQPEPIQADIWRSLAHTSLHLSDQFVAYRSAVNVLKSVGHGLLRAELLLEFAQWLFCNRCDAKMCVALLEQAIDTLLGFHSSVTTRSGQQSGEKMQSSPTRSNSINCLTDVKQLDGLMRAFVLTADTLRTAGLKDEHNWTHYVWLAVACVKRILTLSTSSTARTLQALRRVQPGELESVKSPKSAVGKGKGNPPEINSDRTHAKNVVDHLPRTVGEWSTFEIPEDQLRIWQSALEQTQTESQPVEAVTRKSHAKDKPINADSRVTTTTVSSGSTAALGPLVMQQINRSTFQSPVTRLCAL
ncbi:hypothetical protein P879_02604 [Paragonimus westermani]|uniref:Uncharacterized protein n=1 Tax=Paragonimus westermani TaxID=34504 RepID=A0A8T0DWC4_9TREM|nr:hypothetical protein P879_02604 [Paragonimus westermani]